MTISDTNLIQVKVFEAPVILPATSGNRGGNHVSFHLWDCQDIDGGALR